MASAGAEIGLSPARTQGDNLGDNPTGELSVTGAVMLQGTGSDVGKSILTAGLCRLLTRRGLAVRPFKPQNMSNNAAVAGNGGEIGRAQALQARACRVPPSIDMNPVLLKPQSDTGAQIILRGKVIGAAKADEYQKKKGALLPDVLESFGRLRAEADIVLVEGAGSPAEINLREADIANMGFATAAHVPVVLIGDIDRGGVIASIIGTAGLLSEAERALLKGFIINKFRGDTRLFDGGLIAIEERSGLPSLGVVPYFDLARKLPSEDSFGIRTATPGRKTDITVAVPVFSRISNFDDLDPLSAEPGVSVQFIQPGDPLPAEADLVVLPGTKATLAELAFLRAQGWDIDIKAHYRRGGAVLGICGGYQLLGRSVADPDGLEGAAGQAEGLGLLDVETLIIGDKRLTETAGHEIASGAAVQGYEMHIGETTGKGTRRPMLSLDGRDDGAVSEDGLVAGCYLHGLFSGDEFRRTYLGRLGRQERAILRYETQIEETLDKLAAHLERHLDVDRLLAIAGVG
jgi:adenosylcobyric acid synthase